MSEESKSFWSEHGLNVAMFGGTIALIAGKLAFGWNIGWLWCFAPLWIPFGIALGLVGFMFAVIAFILCVLMVIFGISIAFGGVEIEDEDLEEEEVREEETDEEQSQE